MSSTNKAAWQNIQSKLMAMGYSPQAMVGEPRSKVQSGMIVIIPQGGDIDETTLNAPREIHYTVLRYHRNWLDESQEEETEFILDQFRADIFEDIFGDFELGGNVAHAVPTECSWDYDTISVQGVLYRVVNVTIAYRIDDSATFAP